MIRYVTNNDKGKILSMMELVKDDFAGHEEKGFLEAVHSAISNDETIIEEKEWENSGIAYVLEERKS